MARKVFFSFHYQQDLWRVNVVRNSGLIEGIAAAGFQDASLWEATKRRGDDAVKRLIDDGIRGTSVTVVLIGESTASRLYVNYEIERSVAEGNGLLGITIHNIKDKLGKLGTPGPAPEALLKRNAPIYAWEYGQLGNWVEAAYRTVHP